MDYFPNEYTRQAYEKLSRALYGVYSDALRDVEMKYSSFVYAHEKRVARYQKQVEAGIITQADFEAWMQGQIFQSETWKKRREQMAELLAHADEQALEMVNRGKLNVFAEAANYEAYRIERGGGANYGFGVFDDRTVSRLIHDRPQMLPMPRVDKYKDIEQYNEMLQNAVTQGILQGENLKQIVLRATEYVSQRSYTDILRNASTAYNGAQSAGTLARMQEAKDRGIRIRKRWNCAMMRTSRDWHAELDGQTAELDEPFQTRLGPMMRPGDPEGVPANVYNCHCWLDEVVEGYPEGTRERRDDETGEIAPPKRYEEWKAWKDRKE